MKRVFALLLALGLLFSLAACGEPEPSGTKKPQSEKPNNDKFGTTVTQPTSPVKTKTIYAITQQTFTGFQGEQVVAARETTYVYDDAGRITKVIMVQNGVTQEYAAETDEHGRLSTMKYTHEGSEYVFAYTYDEAGRKLSLTLSQDGRVVQIQSFTYDAQGRETSNQLLVPDMLDQRREYVYEQDRLVKEMLYENGELRQYEQYYYDDQGRIFKSETRMPNDSVYATWDYTYSEDGLTTTKTCERYKLTTVAVRDAHGNVIRTEQIDVGGSSVTEYTYIAIEIPEDTPRQSDKIQGV